MLPPSKTIWTVGHSILPLEDFLHLIRDIDLIVDIRQFPHSRRYPHFNREVLLTTKPYEWLKDLGGRRHDAGERHTAWRVAAFRSYAGYMETEPFQRALARLEELASRQRTAYFCAEALWWRCHRRLVSDALVARGWTVLHLPSGEAHKLSPMARVGSDGTLIYDQPSDPSPLRNRKPQRTEK